MPIKSITIINSDFKKVGIPIGDDKVFCTLSIDTDAPTFVEPPKEPSLALQELRVKHQLLVELFGEEFYSLAQVNQELIWHLYTKWDNFSANPV